MENNQIEDKEYQALKDSKFKQQKLPAWRPVPTVMSTFITFSVFGVIFIVLGVIIIIYSNQAQEYTFRYDNNTLCDSKPKCEVPLNITAEMEQPVIVYYQLDNFYQNHRRYVKSKSNSQLNGEVLTVDQLESDCDPAVTNAEMGKTVSINGTKLDPNAAAFPCGLIAKSFFNDEFKLVKDSGDVFEIDDENIAWESDKNEKFKKPSVTNADSIMWQDVTEERFIVWMRPAGLPNFRKLYGRIKKNVSPGTYKVIIDNNYPVKDFEGKKHFVISTVNAFGGKNYFLGISYIVVGGLCVVIAVLFLFGYKNSSTKKLS